MEDTGYDSPVEQFPLQAAANEVQYDLIVQHPVAQITLWPANQVQLATWIIPRAG
jgi:hypothetical protein